MIEAIANPCAQAVGVLADATAKNYGLRLSRNCQVLADILFDAIAKHFDSQRRVGVTLFGGPDDVTKVGRDTRDSKKSRFVSRPAPMVMG